MAQTLYPEDAVLEMLLKAYEAGFEGPMELAGQVCRDILAKSTHQESDLQLMEFMQERENNKRHKKAMPPPPVEHKWVPPALGKGYPGDEADAFDWE